MPRLWIDAICINQENKEEREGQVRIMKSIYERASMVRVWLGPEAHSSGAGVEFAKRLAIDLPPVGATTKHSLVTAATGFNEMVKHSWVDASPKFKENLHAFRSLLARPWFSRV